MSLNVAQGVLTQPGSTGNQTISLASGFDPKIIFVWTVDRASAGDSASTDPAELGFGAGTYRGSAVQQLFGGIASESADQTSTANASAYGTTALLKLPGANNLDVSAPTADMELRLVSMATGVGSQVVVNWQNLHTTASIKVAYLILGGSDITDAVVGGTTLSTSPQNFTVSGFGQPDLVGMMYCWGDALTGNAAAQFMLGMGIKDGAQAVECFTSNDAAGNVTMAYTQRTDSIFYEESGAASLDGRGTLDASSNWPTDGFRVSYPSVPSSRNVGFFMLKGTFQKALGEETTNTSNAAKDTAVGFTPKAAFLWGGSLPSQGTSTNSTHADLGQIGIGGSDFTNEAHGLYTDDDANANQRGRVSWNESKAWRVQTNAGGTLTTIAEADASASGNNLRLTYTTSNATARAFLYLALGDAAAGTTPVDADALDLVWDARAQVDATARVLKWDTAGAVSQTRVFKWDTIAQVSGNARALKWDLSGAIASSAETFKWDAFSAVDSSTRTALFDVWSAVDATDRDLLWDAPIALTKGPTTLLWDTRAEVNATDRDLLWDVLEQMFPVDGTELDLVWDVPVEVAGNARGLLFDVPAEVDATERDLLWDALAAVQAERTMLWDVGGFVSQGLTAVWDVRSIVAGNTRVIVWDTRGPVARERTVLFDVRGAVNADPGDLIFDVHVRATSAPRQLLWDAAVPLAANGRALLFDVRVPMSGDPRQAVWDVRAQRDALERDLLWDTLASVARGRTLQWDARAALNTLARVLLWDVRVLGQPVEAVLSTDIDLLVDLSTALELEVTLDTTLALDLELMTHADV